MDQDCRNFLIVIVDHDPIMRGDYISFEDRDKVKYRKISETKYDNSRERTITLRYEDSMQSSIEVIIWKVDYKHVLILPSNSKISEAISDYFWIRKSKGLLGIKPTIDMEDIAWNQGSEEFAKSLQNQIDKEQKKKEQEEQERKRIKEEIEKKKREDAIKVASILGLLTGTLGIGEINDLSRKI